MKWQEFNTLTQEKARAELHKCCGSEKWSGSMAAKMPFASLDEMHAIADVIWDQQCEEADWLEAFAHHPKIGDAKSLSEKFAATKDWAGSEQAAVKTASEEVIEALAQRNKDYEEKFGFIFIVCATGKSADEMLALLNQRIHNSYEDELRIAVAEQRKITHLRINKLIHD